MQEHFSDIYQNRADIYDRLVEREDHAGNLAAALLDIGLLQGRQRVEIVEWGAGTGRLTRLLAPFAARLQAFDASAAMLEVAARRRDPADAERIQFAVAPHHQIPLDDAVADVAIEGWSFGHLAEELPPDQGARAVQRAIDQMLRIVRSGGMLILIETLGTGRTTPEPPAPFLDDLYRYFEGQGFARRWCRTDYAFASHEEATELIGAFFGPAMLEHLDPEALTLPECTGLWHRTRA